MLIKSKQNHFFNYIKWRVDNSKNFLCATCGGTGSGKSYANLKAMEILNPDKTPKELIKNVAFSGLQFMDRLNSGELEKGDTMCMEEVGVSLSSKEWQSATNKLVNQILQTFRYLNLIVFFNTPNFAFIDSTSRRLFHAIWETQSIDFNKKLCEIKPLLIQVNSRTGISYFKYLRIKDEQHGLMPVKRIYFGLPSKELVDLYEKTRKEFTSKLSKSVYEELLEIENKPKINKKALTPHQEDVLKKVREGLTLNQIANEFNCSRRAIQQSVGLIRKKGVEVVFRRGK